MRGIVLLALLGAVAIAASAAGAGAETRTALTVTYWENGEQSVKPVVWTLRCSPPRGTHPRPVVSCRRLDAGGWRLFAPVGKNVVCTEIYGGPQVARVVGLVEGRRVWATLSRENGCEIARWGRLSPWLLPPGGAT